MPTLPGYNTGVLPGADGQGEPGSRRRKLAAMAGNIYRSGQQAVTEIRESYAQTRTRGMDGGYDGHGNTHIPGAFPDVAITVKGSDQMVLFPSYAKRHVKRDRTQEPPPNPDEPQGSIRDEEYWRQEWERSEDEKAIVDVDVRGWIYSPHSGPMTRRNRILIGLARQLSGITLPKNDASYGPAQGGPDAPATPHQMHEDIREQEKIAREAARIERKGQEEEKVAYRGGYSEEPQRNLDADGESLYRSRRGSQTPDSAPTSPNLPARRNTAGTSNELSEAELAVGNVNLMARIAPFMTNPFVALPITIFFYNDTQSQSRTVMTNDAGHFIVRAPLEFIPTHVRVLANEDLSATQEVKVTEPYGVSLISDIDDTIKRSNISAGAREIFRNTFVRDLADLSVDGVKEWYNEMHDLGVSIHYCSNSPWQLFPVLASYFKLAGLPPGSLHLKQYTGMLQGIFEPVAERKKSTLNRLMRDFPERKFILVGDSGEADLEVYTELALANPGRILAIFIRDVTTPESTNFFDAGYDMTRRKTASLNLDDGGHPTTSTSSMGRPNWSQGPGSSPANVAKTPPGPAMGTLIDFSEEPQETKLDQSAALDQLKNSSKPSRVASTSDLPTLRKPPPPRPAKPAALRSSPSFTEAQGATGLGLSNNSASDSDDPPPPSLPRRPLVHPLSQIQNSSQQTVGSSKSIPRSAATQARDAAERPPPPPPRRRATPSSIKSLSPRLFGGQGRGPSSNSDVDFDPLPPPSSGPPPPGLSSYPSSRRARSSGGNTPTGSPTMGPAVVNRKLDLWKRRLGRAHDLLEQQGVALYTWRRGQDVVEEAVGIVRQTLEEMERAGHVTSSETGREKGKKHGRR